ncbi:MAG: putative oxidoreductase [Alphaproteobacteria bacterium]|jgi:putative oxidoreductase
MSDTTQTQPIIPALTGVYENLSAFGEPLIRVTAGLLLMPHGAQKLFGLFGGGGISGTAGFFAQIGIEPAVLAAVLVGLVEFLGGLFLALGLLTRPAALAITVLMAVAVFQVHLGNGFFWTGGGYEYPLFWGLIALAFVLRGGGRYSVDARVGREF